MAAALVKAGLEVHAWHDCTMEEYESNIRRVLKAGPDLNLDYQAERAKYEKLTGTKC